MITLSSNSAHPDLCPIRSALRLVLRARQLKQPNTMPLKCYRTKKSPLVYLTASRIAALIWEAVKKVLSKDKGQSPQQIFRSLTMSLGLCPPGRSRQKPWLHPKATSLDGWLLPNVPPQHKKHSGHTLQSPASVKPGYFDPATCTICWHPECAHEWRHRWCLYELILQWNGLKHSYIYNKQFTA